MSSMNYVDCLVDAVAYLICLPILCRSIIICNFIEVCFFARSALFDCSSGLAMCLLIVYKITVLRVRQINKQEFRHCLTHSKTAILMQYSKLHNHVTAKPTPLTVNQMYPPNHQVPPITMTPHDRNSNI